MLRPPLLCEEGNTPHSTFLQFIHTSNENTVVKPAFVFSRRILIPVVVGKATRLCVVSELRLTTWVSVPHMVSADSRRRKCISTSHDRSQQWLFESLAGTSAGNICFGNDNLFSWLPPMHIRSMPLKGEGFLYGSCSETSCPRFRCSPDTHRPMTISGPRRERATYPLQSRTECEPLPFL